MENELIVVRQLPVIEEQLRSFKAQIETEVDKATSLACTEDTLADVKSARARLNETFNALERQRIDVKKQILAPYEQFELVYKECVSGPFKAGDAKLKASINDVELGLKQQIEDDVKAYFEEYITGKGIDFFTFERIGLNITRSVSRKKYKEQVKAIIDRIVDDLAAISAQEDATEILLEYKISLNLSRSIAIVAERHHQIEEELRRQEQAKADAQAREAAISKVEEVIEDEQLELPLAPAQVEEEIPQEQETIYEVTFTVHGTREQIKSLKSFLIKGGYINE